MTAEELIIAVTSEAHVIPPVAYKLLWGIISLAIQRGSGVVQVSMPWLALYTGASRAGIAIAIEQLRKYVEVDSQKGRPLTFRLPEDWLPPQGPLFGGSGPITARRPRISTVITNTPSPPPNPSRNQATDQDGTNPVSRQVWPITGLLSRPLQPGNQAAPVQNLDPFAQDIEMGTRARVDRSIDSGAARSDCIVRVDRALQTVEILPNQREDAALLRDCIIDYRDQMPGRSRMSDSPDDVVIAHILAIADIENLCRVLHTLFQSSVQPGHSDMWFFFTLCDKILGAPPKLVHERMAAAKAKARPYNQKPGLFEAQLLDEVQGKLRRIG